TAITFIWKHSLPIDRVHRFVNPLPAAAGSCEGRAASADDQITDSSAVHMEVHMEKPAARDSSNDSWLGKSAAILALTFPIDVAAGSLADGRRYADNPNVISHQAYEPQVGVPRILDMLSNVGVRATFFVPGITAERWPDTVSQILNSGHEIA